MGAKKRREAREGREGERKIRSIQGRVNCPAGRRVFLKEKEKRGESGRDR